MGKHLLWTRCRTTSSEAILPTFPNMEFKERWLLDCAVELFSIMCRSPNVQYGSQLLPGWSSLSRPICFTVHYSQFAQQRGVLMDRLTAGLFIRRHSAEINECTKTRRYVCMNTPACQSKVSSPWINRCTPAAASFSPGAVPGIIIVLEFWESRILCLDAGDWLIYRPTWTTLKLTTFALVSSDQLLSITRTKFETKKTMKQLWNFCFTFYRAMLRRAQWCPSRPSFCPSGTLRYVFHTGSNTSKIISRPNSLRFLL